ncbi:hypothetical protein NE237_021924 [Protea cynaroides]|uniref:TIR domain-containing protein n=1 Tax=Protea cynaroides TaxID=273540 RepID=A0A9Q0K320_9MAGN|nr:hypothetical protein NE237_021924 [Protea cynaroides]
MTHEASSSSSFSPRWKYDVFLNYHGKDTRNNITAHLFDALQRYGIRTFRDDEKLKNREIIFSELMNEIEGCRIAIPVISENYASSISCLTELVKILQCKRNGQTVLPIFHNIDLSDVKYQKNNFADAFVRRKEEFQKKMEKLESWDLFKEEMENVESWELFEEKMRKLKLWKLVKKEMKEVKLWQLFKEEIENEKSWKTALTEVADLKGFQIENDAKLIKKIVGEVSKIVNETDLHVKNSFGLDSHIEGILRLLNDGLENVHFLGIYGPAGIGKTTIAKVLYNKMLQSFGGSCSFLVMAEGVSRKQKSLVTLQKQLLFDVLGRVYDIDNEHRGVNIIQHVYGVKKFLLFLMTLMK